MLSVSMSPVPYEVRLLTVHELDRKNILAFSLGAKDNPRLVEPILAGHRLIIALIINTGNA